MSSSTTKTVIGTAVVVVLAISIGLIASSLKKLSSEEAGIMYDKNLHKLKDGIYFNGLHAGPPGFEFIIFPKIFRTISFNPLVCLNKDGVDIELTVQFQYLALLSGDNLKKLVLEFRTHDNYKNVLSDAAFETILDACSKYTITEFQTDRSGFQALILNSLQEKLRDFSATIKDVQVNNIKRPRKYELVVRDKEAAKQNIEVALQERPRIILAADTKRKEAIAQANITITKAQTQANIIKAKAEADAAAIINAYTTEANTYKNIMISHNLTIDGLISYLGIRAIQNNAVKGINLDSPAKTSFP